ncbi:MAG TPA: LacI family DNA-binding transcriptional regulator [Rhizobiaceae bacterium]|nr:LacI family DNA-binding transcriptional regulator [Rhizobiaceae bacterium]
MEEKIVRSVDRAPTISDVAQQAKVSRATVSRAFGQPQLLSREMVAHVRAIAERLGYVPNHTARALSTGKAGNLALLVPDITNPFFASLMRGVQGRALGIQYATFLADSDEDPALEDVLIAKLAAQVDGFILASPRLPKKTLLQHAGRRVCVLINRDIPNFARILVDGAKSYEEAVEHLARLGHRTAAYVSGPRLSWSNGQRLRAVLAAGMRHGVKIVQFATDRPTFEAGEACVAGLIESGTTAVLAYDDLLAQGIMAGLARHGLSVPEDFSVVGCDGVLATRTYPPLTSVAIDCQSAGEQAVELLVDVMRGKSASGRRIVLSSDLVIRATTARPRPGGRTYQAPAPASPTRTKSE